MLWSLSRGSSGPRPKISSRISRASRSRSAKLSGTASLFTRLRMRISTSSRAVSLLVRPNFSRSRRSRIFRCRSALTCWYSPRSNVGEFGMGSLHRPEQRPGGPFYLIVVLRQNRCQAAEGPRDLGIALLHDRDATIDRARDRKIVIWNFPEQSHPGGRLRFLFLEADHLPVPVEYEFNPLPAVRLTQILHDAGGAPKRRHVSVRHE